MAKAAFAKALGKFVGPKVFLIGMPGSGKSYWSSRIAKKLKCGSYDLDKLIESWTDQTIAELFAAENGEENFRKTESKLLRWFADKKSFVLATGGGTPCFFDNMAWMNKQGLTIWIKDEQPTLVHRLISEKEHRPMISKLSNAELEDFIYSKSVEREPYYHQAKVVLSGNEISEKEIFNAINLHLV